MGGFTFWLPSRQDIGPDGRRVQPEGENMAGISPMLGVRDMKRTIDFYENILGFAAGKVLPDRENAKYVDFSRYGAVLMFQPLSMMKDGLIENFRLPNATESEPGVGVVHYVDFPKYEDIDAYYADLKTKGVAIVKDLSDRSWGARDFMIADPDGHLLSFTKPNEESAKCLSCGMPIPKPDDHSTGNPKNPYCKNCADESGKIKPFDEIAEGMKNYLVSQGVSDPDVGVKAKEHLRKMPAWKSN